MDDDPIQLKLPNEPQGGADVVRPVGVEMGLHLPLQHREQRLTLHIQLRRVGILILLGLAAVLSIPLCLLQLLPDDGGDSHAGHGGLGFIVVDPLGVLPQGKLHPHWRLYHHFVHHPAPGLHGADLAGHRVGAAGAGDHGGDAVVQRLAKGPVQWVDGVDGPKVGGAGVGHFVAVVPFKIQPLLPHPQVAVGVDEAGGYDFPLGVQHLPVRSAVDPGGDLCNLSILQADVPLLDHRSIPYMDDAALDNHFFSFPHLRYSIIRSLVCGRSIWQLIKYSAITPSRPGSVSLYWSGSRFTIPPRIAPSGETGI